MKNRIEGTFAAIYIPAECNQEADENKIQIRIKSGDDKIDVGFYILDNTTTEQIGRNFLEALQRMLI